MPSGPTDLFGFWFLRWVSRLPQLIGISGITFIMSYLGGSGSGALSTGVKIDAN